MALGTVVIILLYVNILGIIIFFMEVLVHVDAIVISSIWAFLII